MAQGSDWKIGRRVGECGGCRRAFRDGEAMFTALAIEGEQVVRDDRCSSCFAAPDAQSVFWWRSRYSVDRRRGVQFNLDALERLFVHLEGRCELPLRELRYVLCLILLRKRRLKVRQILRDGDGESFVVNRPRRQEALQVYVFDFSAERIDELRARLQQIFEGAEPDLAPTVDDAPATEPHAEAIHEPS